MQPHKLRATLEQRYLDVNSYFSQTIPVVTSLLIIIISNVSSIHQHCYYLFFFEVLLRNLCILLQISVYEITNNVIEKLSPYKNK